MEPKLRCAYPNERKQTSISRGRSRMIFNSAPARGSVPSTRTERRTRTMRKEKKKPTANASPVPGAPVLSVFPSIAVIVSIILVGQLNGCTGPEYPGFRPEVDGAGKPRLTRAHRHSGLPLSPAFQTAGSHNPGSTSVGHPYIAARQET